MKTGIYKIINKINRRFYIGSSIDIDTRWKQHKRNAKLGSMYPIHTAIRKYGIDSFELIVIQECSKSELLIIEQDWLDEVYENPLCYNIAENASAPMRNKKHSEETKNKISNCKIENYKNITDLRYKVGSGNRGRKQTKEEIECRASKLRGRNYSNEHKKSISIKAIKRYDTHGSSYPSLVNNNGDIVPAGNNIRRLAKKLDVNHANLHQVIYGKRKSAGGWRIL